MKNLIGIFLATALLFTGSIVSSKFAVPAYGEQLGLSIYAPGEVKSTTQDIMQRYMVNPTDVLLFQAIHTDKFPGIVVVDGGYCISCANTIDGTKSVKRAIADAPKYGTTVIGYNMEHWEYTPSTEQADPIGSANTAAQLAHNAGLKYMFNPDGGFLYNKDPATGIRYYKEYNWKNIDYLLIEFQSKRFAGGLAADGKDVTAFRNNVKMIADTARSQNPNIVIFEQLSLTFDSPQTIIDKTNAISDLVNGVVYFYKPGDRCTACTPSNLSTILHALRPTL